jgi:hypothetical protein
MVSDDLPLEEMVRRHFVSAVEAAGIMFSKDPYGYFLVVIYSSIDTLGLLDAPPEQLSTTSSSFKAWATKYFLPQTSGDYDATELWAARCAILHTFTTESDLSRSGRARQLQYYFASGDAARNFVAINNQIDNGAHVAVHLGDFGRAHVSSMQSFVPDLLAKCASSEAHARRLRNVLQIYPMQPAP